MRHFAPVEDSTGEVKQTAYLYSAISWAAHL